MRTLLCTVEVLDLSAAAGLRTGGSGVRGVDMKTPPAFPPSL